MVLFALRRGPWCTQGRHRPPDPSHCIGLVVLRSPRASWPNRPEGDCRAVALCGSVWDLGAMLMVSRWRVDVPPSPPPHTHTHSHHLLFPSPHHPHPHLPRRRTPLKFTPASKPATLTCWSSPGQPHHDNCCQTHECVGHGGQWGAVWEVHEMRPCINLSAPTVHLVVTTNSCGLCGGDGSETTLLTCQKPKRAL